METQDNSNLMESYMEMFDNLHIGKVPYVAHKHVATLLIAIINCIQKGILNSRKIFYIPELEYEYNEVWKSCISKANPKVYAGAPFIELNNESFYSIQTLRPITNYDRVWNRQNIYSYVKFALLDEDLFHILCNERCRVELCSYLLERYCDKISESSKKAAVGCIGKGMTAQEILTKIDMDSFCEMNFISFMESVKTREGKPYPKYVITSYVNALKGDYICMLNKQTDSIYSIRNAHTLMILENMICKDYHKGKIYNTALAAIRFYIRYVNAIKRVKDKYTTGNV